jgi:hypothetical protein
MGLNEDKLVQAAAQARSRRIQNSRSARTSRVRWWTDLLHRAGGVVQSVDGRKKKICCAQMIFASKSVGISHCSDEIMRSKSVF